MLIAIVRIGEDGFKQFSGVSESPICFSVEEGGDYREMNYGHVTFARYDPETQSSWSLERFQVVKEVVDGKEVYADFRTMTDEETLHCITFIVKENSDLLNQSYAKSLADARKKLH